MHNFKNIRKIIIFKTFFSGFLGQVYTPLPPQFNEDDNSMFLITLLKFTYQYHILLSGAFLWLKDQHLNSHLYHQPANKHDNLQSFSLLQEAYHRNIWFLGYIIYQAVHDAGMIFHFSRTTEKNIIHTEITWFQNTIKLKIKVLSIIKVTF